MSKRKRGIDSSMYRHKASVIKVAVAMLRDVMGLRMDEALPQILMCWHYMERYEPNEDREALSDK